MTISITAWQTLSTVAPLPQPQRPHRPQITPQPHQRSAEPTGVNKREQAGTRLGSISAHRVTVSDTPRYAGPVTAVWAILAFLLGWKAATATGGHPAAAVSSAASSAKTAAHQMVAQVTNTVWATVWSVAWHVVVIGAVVLALVYGASLVLRRARRNITGH
jgi:hypothetical protein